MYRVQLAPCVAEAFAELHPDIRKQLKTGMKDIAKAPYIGKILQGELSEFLSFRIRRHRIIYKVIDNQKSIKVFMIGHRKEIYNLLEQLVQKS